jgi:hypothetical protein
VCVYSMSFQERFSLQDPIPCTHPGTPHRLGLQYLSAPFRNGRTRRRLARALQDTAGCQKHVWSAAIRTAPLPWAGLLRYARVTEHYVPRNVSFVATPPIAVRHQDSNVLSVAVLLRKGNRWYPSRPGSPLTSSRERRREHHKCVSTCSFVQPSPAEASLPGRQHLGHTLAYHLAEDTPQGRPTSFH